MKDERMRALLKEQRDFFRSGATLPVSFRIQQLKRLYGAIKRHEEDIHAALREDLGKGAYEGFMCETGLVLSELSYMVRHIRKFAGQKRCIRRWRSLLRIVLNCRFLMEMC